MYMYANEFTYITVNQSITVTSIKFPTDELMMPYPEAPTIATQQAQVFFDSTEGGIFVPLPDGCLRRREILRDGVVSV